MPLLSLSLCHHVKLSSAAQYLSALFQWDCTIDSPLLPLPLLVNGLLDKTVTDALCNAYAMS